MNVAETRSPVRTEIEPCPPPRHDARVLTDHRGLAQIVLDGNVYTLRITRQHKLILTK